MRPTAASTVRNVPRVPRVLAVAAGVAGVAACLLTLLTPRIAAGQGTCTVNNQTNCTAAGSVTQALRITITAATRLIIPVGDFVMPVPEATALSTSFGIPLPIAVTVNSNKPWSLSLNATAATWSRISGLARLDKPSTDLQWGLSAGGAFFGVTTAPVTITNGAATSAAIPLHLRVRYDFGLDVAGGYSLPLTLVITAP